MAGLSVSTPVLTVENLSVSFRQEEGVSTPVRDVSLQIGKGETLALVGESGSGKSVTSLAVMGLLPKPAGFVSAGRIEFQSRAHQQIDLATLPFAQARLLRGREMAMIFQEPMTSLNPVLTIGEQIAETVRLHLGLSGRALQAHVRAQLDLVEIPDAGRRMEDYPHQMSGGMRQRVMIALAMACNPSLLIADEPTTALDVTIQAQILSLIDRLRRETGMAVLFITHNLGVVAEIADRVSVMYGGQVVETASTQTLFKTPRHPYTQALLSCLPARAKTDSQGIKRLQAIAGQPGVFGQACGFAPRCPFAQDDCHQTAPVLETVDAGSVRCLRWRDVTSAEGLA
jgi:peptide/nickel transport system ATP-binding protein